MLAAVDERTLVAPTEGRKQKCVRKMIKRPGPDRSLLFITQAYSARSQRRR